MKNILKTLAINVCILFVLGYPLFLAAQTSGVPSYRGTDPRSGLDPNSAFSRNLAEIQRRMDPGYAQPSEAKAFLTNSPAWKKQVKEAVFDGLPMSEVIHWLRLQFPEVNFVNAQEIDGVPVNLTLRSATLDDILTALSITTKGELIADRMNEKMVALYLQPQFPQAENQKKISRAFSLAGYLAGKSPQETANALKDLENALTVSWDMLANANSDKNMPKPSLNLHAPTKMLIVVGTPEQLDMVSQFIDQLRANTYVFSQPRPTVAPAPITPAPTEPLPTPQPLRLAPYSPSTKTPVSPK